MKELAWFALLVVLPLGCGGKSESSKTDAGEKPEMPAETGEEAIAAIRKLGGRVVDGYVIFDGSNVTDAGLVHLKALTNLHNLAKESGYLLAVWFTAA